MNFNQNNQLAGTFHLAYKKYVTRRAWLFPGCIFSVARGKGLHDGRHR